MPNMAATHLIASVVILLCVLVCVSAGFRIPRLGAHPTRILREFDAERRNDVLTNSSSVFYYTQTLDHFNFRPESYNTFQQKYIINSAYWAGANASAPIFVDLGAELAYGDSVSDFGIAARFNGLMVGIEHRYYGESIPFGSRDEAFKNASTLGYFSSTQAIADYAEIILYIKKNLSAENCPVIVSGGSYGGMLATWFRLKYPHVAIGALASSAPILYFDGIAPREGFYAIVSKDFMETSMSCHDTIRKSWSMIDEIGAQPDGLQTLSRMFKTCAPLITYFDIKYFLDNIYALAAQYNRGPRYMLSQICTAIDGAPAGTTALGRVVAGFESFMGNSTCYNISGSIPIYQSRRSAPSDDIYEDGWGWQTCTEMVMPIGHDNASTMFQYAPFDLNEFSESCRKKYGVEPRAHWVTTEFGGQDIKDVLAKFGSNIIFSNGLKDPYSSGGVLYNISDSIVALTTANGSHCMDLISYSSDIPEWIVEQRESEMEIMGRWIADYHKVHLNRSVLN